MRNSSQPTNWTLGAVMLALVGSGFVGNDSSEARCECNQKMEALLERDFSFYSDTESILEFDYRVDKRSQHVEVDLHGLNFDSDDSEWTARDRGDFKDFLGAVGVTVSYEMRRPIVR